MLVDSMRLDQETYVMDMSMLNQTSSLLSSDSDLLLKDKRLYGLLHGSCRYELRAPGTLEKWKSRREEIKTQILVSAGLWPMPGKCDLNARIFDKEVFDGFSVEKVIFESYPGLYVTGNIFRPLNKKEPFPAVLNPHGHWEDGRLVCSDLGNIFLGCANFAQMGFIAFSYDMINYQDSKLPHSNDYFLHAGVQIDYKYRNFPEELWGMSLFGLQLWNSIRCVDFLQSLPDTDAGNIGCTGSSGGGTQTFFLAAVDGRVKVTAPVNMISATFQGGCSCENTPGLRIGTNNVEIAAVTAPRPMLMVGCTGDWTVDTPSVEYPAIRSIYKLYDQCDKLDYFYDDAEHNYNKNARHAAYWWFNMHLAGRDESWSEQEVSFGDLKRFKVFDVDIAADGSLSGDELFERFKKDRIETLKNLYGDIKGKDTLKTAMKHIIGTDKSREYIPAVIFKNKKDQESEKVALIIHSGGREAIFKDDKWHPMIDNLYKMDFSIIFLDPFFTGEFYNTCRFKPTDTPETQFYTTFNHTNTALRIQDIIATYFYILEKGVKEISVIGLQSAGSWCLAALPFLDGIRHAAIDMSVLNPGDDTWYMENFFVPGFCSAGGFETLVRLRLLDKLLLFNTEGNPFVDKVREIYKENGQEDNVVIYRSMPQEDIFYEY